MASGFRQFGAASLGTFQVLDRALVEYPNTRKAFSEAMGLKQRIARTCESDSLFGNPCANRRASPSLVRCFLVRFGPLGLLKAYLPRTQAVRR